jgi:ABC-type glutathione transport system ATPase component
MTALLRVKDLKVTIGLVTLLDGVSFALGRGEILGLGGESGSGKSLTAMAVMGLLPLSGGRVSGGSIRFDGRSSALSTRSATASCAASRARPHRLRQRRTVHAALRAPHLCQRAAPDLPAGPRPGTLAETLFTAAAPRVGKPGHPKVLV